MPPSEDLVIALYRLGLVQRSMARHALAELGSQGFTALAVVTREGPVRDPCAPIFPGGSVFMGPGLARCALQPG